MNNFISYDIEIYNDMQEGQPIKELIPSIAALGYLKYSTLDCKEHEVEFFYDEPFMTKETAQKLVKVMMNMMSDGDRIFTWNGLKFDFPLLAEYSGMIEECANIALNHIDGMFILVAIKGFLLGLDATLKGAKLETKTHTVKLKDGTIINDMNGSKAPELWRNGEIEAVKTYLAGDVIQPLKLIDVIQRDHGIFWTSKTGRPNFVNSNLLTVKECMKLSLPDTSWMTNPIPRSDFYSWIPEKVLNQNGIINQ